MANLGFDLFLNLVGYVFVLIGVLLLHMLITLQAVLAFLGRLNPLVFLAKMRNVQVFAFSTSSSNATIPVTLRTVTERLGVNNSVASFSVPFGATINMDGTAIMQGVATVFIANMYNGNYTFYTYRSNIRTLDYWLRHNDTFFSSYTRISWYCSQ